MENVVDQGAFHAEERWCDECGEEVAAYKGESGRNGYTRVGEHLEYWVA